MWHLMQSTTNTIFDWVFLIHHCEKCLQECGWHRCYFVVCQSPIRLRLIKMNCTNLGCMSAFQLSLLSELGFGGILLYVDPCDAPLDRHTWHQAFRVTLNPGGNPALSKTLCQSPFFFEKKMKTYCCCGFDYSLRCSCLIFAFWWLNDRK